MRVDRVIERTGATHQHACPASRLIVGILQTSMPFEEVLIVTALSRAVRKEEGTGRALSSVAVGVGVAVGGMYAQARIAARGAIGVNPFCRFMHTFDDVVVRYSRSTRSFLFISWCISLMIQPTLLLGLPCSFAVEGITIAEQLLTVSLFLETSEAACPLCQQAAHRVHSRSVRTLQDLPCGGKTIRLLVRVRRFFGENELCTRKIFAERLPELTRAYARRTLRRRAALAELGLALGGKAAASLGAAPGLPGSRMTILRILRTPPLPAVPTPRMLGIDEWAYRRGKKYGTLLVDLETGLPVDVLPDHQAATVETWLRTHPGVQLISRDRGGEIARGARLALGLPKRSRQRIGSMCCAI